MLRKSKKPPLPPPPPLLDATSLIQRDLCLGYLHLFLLEFLLMCVMKGLRTFAKGWRTSWRSVQPWLGLKRKDALVSGLVRGSNVPRAGLLLPPGDGLSEHCGYCGVRWEKEAERPSPGKVPGGVRSLHTQGCFSLEEMNILYLLKSCFLLQGGNWCQGLQKVMYLLEVDCLEKIKRGLHG